MVFDKIYDWVHSIHSSFNDYLDLKKEDEIRRMESRIKVLGMKLKLQRLRSKEMELKERVEPREPIEGFIFGDSLGMNGDPVLRETISLNPYREEEVILL